MELNFNKVVKNYLNVTLIDGRSFMVGTPNKKLLNEIMAMDKKIKADDITDTSQVDDVYKISAEIMSINKTKAKITGKELSEIWDVEDLFLFFNTYMRFLDSVVNVKN